MIDALPRTSELVFPRDGPDLRTVQKRAGLSDVGQTKEYTD